MIKGAPFVPTRMVQVDRMLEAANLKKGMKLYDLGAGDGRLVHQAANKYNVTAIGYEYSPLVWLWSKFLCLFWKSNAKLKYGNFWKKDISDANVVVCYLLPHSMEQMEKMLFPKLKPGAILISHAFSMPNTKPYKILNRDNEQKLGKVWIYKR